MLDVCITVSDSTPLGWVTQCQQSVAAAAAFATYPVNVITVPGVPGNIGMAMANGIRAGANPYVAWVDDDDWVLPNAFEVLKPYFKAKPPAICAREIHTFANGHIVPCDMRHHLTAWRRDVLDVAALETNPAYPLVPLLAAVENTAADVNAWVYMRRMWISGGAKLRSIHDRSSI